MGRPPGEHERVVKYLVDLDSWDYGDEHALWLSLYVTGPVMEPGVVDRPCVDRLILESTSLFTPDEIEELRERLIQDQKLTLPMSLLTFQSDWTPDGNFLDLNYNPTDVILAVDDFSYYRVEAQLDSDEHVEFGLEVFRKLLFGPAELTHWERRCWQLMCLASERLRVAVQTRICAAATESTFFELETALAPRGQYFAVAPNKLRDRERIVHALIRDNAAFTRAQIGIILYYDHPTLDVDTGEFHRVSADDQTVNRLIGRARINPVLGTRFSSRQITHVLVPIAVEQTTWEHRYEAIRDELRRAGVAVPDQPAVEFR